VGKTTVAASLGIALVQMRKSVVLVDADVAMANLGIFLGMESCPITLHDVLLGEAAMRDAMYEGPAGVKFVPSGLSLDSYRRVDSEKLESAMSELENICDVALIDAPAGLSKDVLSAISCGKELLLVTTPEPSALADAMKTKVMAERLGSKPIGVALNMVIGDKSEVSKEEVESLLELQVLAQIPEDIEVRRASATHTPVILRSPNSPAARAIRALAGAITGEQVAVAEEKRPGLFARLFGMFKRKPKPAAAAKKAKKNVQ
jgi:septum site-determining protein MinD